jgi:hypothetical protein
VEPSRNKPPPTLKYGLVQLKRKGKAALKDRKMLPVLHGSPPPMPGR